MNGYFNPQISLGTILHLVVLVVTLVGVYWKMREFVKDLHAENRQALMEMKVNVERLHSENRQALAEVKSTMHSMKSQVDSLWEWFTQRLERRNPRGGTDC